MVDGKVLITARIKLTGIYMCVNNEVVEDFLIIFMVIRTTTSNHGYHYYYYSHLELPKGGIESIGQG